MQILRDDSFRAEFHAGQNRLAELLITDDTAISQVVVRKQRQRSQMKMRDVLENSTRTIIQARIVSTIAITRLVVPCQSGVD